MREWEGRFEAMVSGAADTWSSTANRLACSGLFPPFYLYCRPSTAREDGALFMVPEGTEPSSSSWVLGDAEPYRANLNRDAVRARVWTVARRLPILRCDDIRAEA